MTPTRAPGVFLEWHLRLPHAAPVSVLIPHVHPDLPNVTLGACRN